MSGKSDYDKYLNKNTGLMDKEKIEHSTTSRDNRRIFIYSAGYRRALDRWQSTGKVRGKYWIVIEWKWSGIEVVTRKKAERNRQKAEGR